MGDLGSIPGLGRSPGEGTGYPLQYSGLENSMNCIVHGVSKSQTRLSDFHFHFDYFMFSTFSSSFSDFYNAFSVFTFNFSKIYKALPTLCCWNLPDKILYIYFTFSLSVPFQFSSVAQSCPTLCDPMNCSMPCLCVHHQLLEFTQTHAHQVNDAIQPSHPLSSPSSPAPNLSQHQGLFQ